MKIAYFCLVLGLGAPAALHAQTFQSSVDQSQLRSEKRTPQMKYLSSQDAFDILTADPNILFVDVRDPVEVKLHGHPSLVDAVIPLRAQSSEFDDVLLEWVLRDNPNFLMYMDDALQTFGKTKTDMIIITCGSGWRSAEAARRLHADGFTDVWHITDGYPGEEKPGINIANAWQLAGLPWSYDQVHGSNRLHVLE